MQGVQCLDDMSACVLACTDRFTREMNTCDEVVFTSGTEVGSSVQSQDREEKGHKDRQDRPRIYVIRCVCHRHLHTNIQSVHTVNHNN